MEKNTKRSTTPSKYVPTTKKNYGWVWGLLVVIVVAAVVGVSIWMGVASNQKKASGASAKLENAVLKVEKNYLEFKSENVAKGAPVMEMFEDPRCPGCSELSKTHGEEFVDAINDGKIILRVYLLDFLNSQGLTQYSTRANASLLEVAKTGDAAATYRYHSILWHNTPPEGPEHHEYTNEELADFAKEAKADESAVKNIAAGAVDTIGTAKVCQENLLELNKRMNNQGATPAVFVNGKQVNSGDPDWLKRIVKD